METKTGTIKALSLQKGGILLEESPNQWLNPIKGLDSETWKNLKKGDKITLEGEGNSYTSIKVITPSYQQQTNNPTSGIVSKMISSARNHEDNKNKCIVREACLNSAIEYYKIGGYKPTEEQILELAEKFEKWVLR